MYIKQFFSVWRLLLRIWPSVLGITLYATLVFYLYEHFNWHFLLFPISVVTVVGTALSLLLGFRTNSAYDRWWEARKIWGEIVNDSRTLVRQTMAFVKASEEEEARLARHIAHLQIAWCYALANSLRKLPVMVRADLHLNEEEKAFVAHHDNVPNAILQLIQNQFRDAYDQGYLHPLFFQNLDDTIRRLCDAMGKCERIKSTVFPTQYSFFILITVVIFTLILPMGLVDSIGGLAIPVTFMISWLFLYVESIAFIMQNPFENNANDTPMTAISRTIEINLLQLIEEAVVPDKTKPKDGYVM
ncbi:bestrophin family ion channel [Rhabdobacter roseus]|uniref:Putative membrane protein n=1 Tax=Rhabdobacter roseus TaxID=1655419 RepID=A0A840U491_9BACT|nr:bestrophin family ion channel [Rhabdobacter roseus]MBB5286910.1 putative membrane protein [Rhabdobacter roseus]